MCARVRISRRVGFLRWKTKTLIRGIELSNGRNAAHARFLLTGYLLLGGGWGSESGAPGPSSAVGSRRSADVNRRGARVADAKRDGDRAPWRGRRRGA